MAVLAITRTAACELRRAEQEQLALNVLLLATVCGCTRCGDASDLARLKDEIRRSETTIQSLSDAITDWSGVCL